MTVSELFRATFGAEPAACTELTGSGSARRYYRLTARSGASFIGTEGTNRAENEAFIYLDSHFAQKGINVPEIISVSPDRLTYLQTDLGSTSLFDLIREEGHDGDNVRRFVESTLTQLPEIQYGAADGLDFDKCYPVASMDRRSVMWDLNYFKYSFLKVTGIEYDENSLEDDFERFASLILADMPDAFMYRDLQSRNIMIHDDASWFIDFQGGRKGNPLYDVASLLWQARAGFSGLFRKDMAEVYRLKCAERFGLWTNQEKFTEALNLMALFRTIQVLGAYGFRGLIEQKVNFIVSIPQAVENLFDLADIISPIKMPELRRVLDAITALPQFQLSEPRTNLIVTVNSFGFRKSGIPRDYSGNGGGFVFDCRSITNPGRYDEFKPLTGLDKPVADFLEDNGEITRMLENARAIVGPAVERYISRGFTDLMISFGCTGGRHRSVYSADNMARWINDTYGVEVHINHIERNIKKTIPAKR